MKISITDKCALITDDEALLAKIEGVTVNDVEIPEEYKTINADSLATAYDRATFSPHQYKVVDGEISTKENENIKLYAVLKQRFISSFNK